MSGRTEGGAVDVSAPCHDIDRAARLANIATAAGLETPDLDARLIVEHFTGTTRADLIARPDTAIAPDVDQGHRMQPLPAVLPASRCIASLAIANSTGSSSAFRPKRWSRGRTPKLWSMLSCHSPETSLPAPASAASSTSAPARARLRWLCSAKYRKPRQPASTFLRARVDTATRNAAALGLADRFTAMRIRLVCKNFRPL